MRYLSMAIVFSFATTSALALPTTLLASPVTQFCGDRYCPTTATPGYAKRTTPKGGLRQVRYPERHHREARTESRHGCDVALSSATQRLVALINAKLDRWVRRTGQCAGGEEVLATYYSSGSRTSSGERFIPSGLTAASRTIPFGTRLRVTNPHNGRTTTVRVNDCGPYTHAKIDLSLGAARALGLRQSSYVCVATAGSDTLARE